MVRALIPFAKLDILPDLKKSQKVGILEDGTGHCTDKSVSIL